MLFVNPFSFFVFFVFMLCFVLCFYSLCRLTLSLFYNLLCFCLVYVFVTFPVSFDSFVFTGGRVNGLYPQEAFAAVLFSPRWAGGVFLVHSFVFGYMQCNILCKWTFTRGLGALLLLYRVRLCQ